jgi:glycosyltransferase involved in cell wall biosynthesis
VSALPTEETAVYPLPAAQARVRVAWVAEVPVPYRVRLYRRLREEAGIDLKVLFCTASQAGRGWTAPLDDVPHIVLPGRSFRVRVNSREHLHLRVNPSVCRELTLFQPDLVIVGGYAHFTMQWAMLWCRRTGTPYLLNSESHHWRSRGGWLRALKRLPVRFFVHGAAAGLPVGSLAREYLVSYGGPADRMFLLPNTCDVAWFARESERARAQRALLRARLRLGVGPVALYVGALAPEKDLGTLLRAFRALTPPTADLVEAGCRSTQDGISTSVLPQLLFVGDGEERASLESLARELGLAERVRFAGTRPWRELPAMYALADLLVLPSRFETWGAVVNEALAVGLPVIVSDQVGCAPDLVRPGENGWIVPVGDVDALAAVLSDALADPVRLAAMGAASARLAPAWSEDRCLEALRAAVRSVLGGHRGSRRGRKLM